LPALAGYRPRADLLLSLARFTLKS
jgi:hypothetical protein